MFASKSRLNTPIALFCLVAYGAQFSPCLPSNDPNSWWPDPITGLMWAGHAADNNGRGLNWQESKAYCSSLQLGGYGGWRLPTSDEVMAIAYQVHVEPFNGSYNPYDRYSLKGGISGPYSLGDYSIPGTWTSTLWSNNEAMMGPISSDPPLVHSLLDFKFFVICTRPMEADLLQVAKDAEVVYPVPNLLTLKATIPLSKAELAYQAGNYEESITQSKNALLVKPDFATAYWAIGISYGMLGEWNLAITNLETALNIDKNCGDAKDALKWAQQNEKASKKRNRSKLQDPQWNWKLEPALCFKRLVQQNSSWACQN